MKNIRIYLVIAVALIVVSAGFWFSAAEASEQISGDTVIVKDRVVEEDLLALGSSVDVQAEIRGDLTAAGSNVEISAPIAGYLLAAGSNVTINNSVGNDLWAAGSNITVKGSVGDNAMLAGSVIKLTPESSVKSDARIAGGTIDVQGRIGGNLNVAGGEVRISSEVVGNVNANTGRLIIQPGAVIRGNLIVRGTQQPEISPQAQVLGKVDFQQADQRNPLVAWFGWWVYWFLALLLTGFAVLLLSKIWANRVAQTIVGKPLYSLLAGFLGLILIPVVIVMLAVILIGIPLALILLAFYSVFLMLAGVFTAYFIGGWLLGVINRPQASPWLRMLIGVLVLSFAVSLPWIGWLVQFAALLFGFGALMLERWNLRGHLQAERLA